MKTVFSGIQPTGNLHLGNYLGSIKNWIDLQDQHRCIFGVMNLHAITLPQDPKELQKNILDATAVYLAAGLDPKKSIIFVQGEVAQHAELAWVLGTITPMGWLNRMTQFKDKAKLVDIYADVTKLLLTDIKIERSTMSIYSELSNADRRINEIFKNMEKGFGFFKRLLLTFFKPRLKSHYRDELGSLKTKMDNETSENEENYLVLEEIVKKVEDARQKFDEKSNATLGLFSYPVLMAADILLYRADLVPVGEDQKQHLELTRDLAGAFNRRYNQEYFKLPEPMIVKDVKRIMSLQDGLKKMSKSDESDLSRINLEDSPEVILKKVKKAKTDSLPTINFDEARPEIHNLLNIFAASSGKSPQDLAKEYETVGNGKFKTDLAESLIEKLRPIQENLTRFKQDQTYIRQVLAEGKNQAREIAAKTKKEVFEIVGL